MDSFVTGEKNHTQESIREELEQLYIAAGYIHADDGDMEVAIHLIGAAIVALESPDEPETDPHIRMVYSRKDPTD